MSGEVDTSLAMKTSLDQAGFSALAAQPGLTILDFTAQWCPPCKALAPILERAAAHHHVRLAAIDTDEQPELAERFGVRAMPTVVLWRDGKEVGRFVGLRSAAFVNGVVTRALAGEESITSP